MGFIYQESNAYGVEALVALERHYTPTEEKYCTAVTEAVRICDTYGIPERELVPQVRHIAAAEEYLLEHLSEDEEPLQFLFTPSPAATPVWRGFWHGTTFAPAAKKLINIQATHPSSGCGTSSPPWASIRRTPSPRRSSWTPSATSSTIWTSPACPLPTGGGC